MIPPRLMASRWATKRSGSRNGPMAGRRTRSSWCPDGVYEHFAAGIGARGAEARAEWAELFSAYRGEYPELATEIDQMQRRELPAGWDRNLPAFPADAERYRRPGRIGKGVERSRAKYSMVSRRFGGPGAVEQDSFDIPRRGRCSGRHVLGGRICTSEFASTRWRRL